MQTMKAPAKKEAREGLWLGDVPTPKIGINDVLIEVLRAGMLLQREEDEYDFKNRPRGVIATIASRRWAFDPRGR